MSHLAGDAAGESMQGPTTTTSDGVVNTVDCTKCNALGTRLFCLSYREFPADREVLRGAAVSVVSRCQSRGERGC